MTAYALEKDSSLRINDIFFNEQIGKVIDVVVPQVEGLLRRHVLFHLFFACLGSAEFFLLLFFFNTIAGSSLIAFSLGALFFTLFIYFVLRLYLIYRKEELLKKARSRFLRGCKELIEHKPGSLEHHIALANACTRLADRLDRKEYGHYSPPLWLGFLSSLMERFSWWCHWQDYHMLKELLLEDAVAENIEMVKLAPTSLDVHTSLANAYVMLSGLYVDPSILDGGSGGPWVPEDKRELMQQDFRKTAEKAIEEFKILSSFAPDAPWVHTQLAYSYHDLQMPEEEIREYEIIHRLVPHDDDCLFKLGGLYFQQGLNAQGLEIYAKLCQTNTAKAQALIDRYSG